MVTFYFLLNCLKICILLDIVNVKAVPLDKILELSKIENLLTRSQISSLSSGSYLYMIEKSWLEDLKCYIKKNTRKFSDEISCNTFPRPLTLSRDGSNDYIEEELWIQLVKVFGVDKSHDLSRILTKDYNQVSYPADYIMTKVDVIENNHGFAKLGMFPSLWMFPKEERLGYIMTQLRHYYNVPSRKRSRLWFAQSLPTSWLVTDLNKTVCNVRGAVNPELFTLNGVQGAQYFEITKKAFINSPFISNSQYQQYRYNPYGKNPQDFSYRVNDFADNAGCSPMFGLLVLEVESSNGKWPTKRYPHLIPENPFDLSLGRVQLLEDDLDDVNKKNTSESIEQWVKEIIDRIETELKEEMLSVYDVAKGQGEQRCERLEDRETYMHALEEGLKKLQEQTNGLKSRLRELRGYN